MTQLGRNQQHVLRLLFERGSFPGGGWVLDTHGMTKTICESLLRRGLVTKNHRFGYPSFHLTDEGNDEARHLLAAEGRFR